jgi:hypothetical protein
MLALLLVGLGAPSSPTGSFFRIDCLDAATRLPVPLVTLRTSHYVELVSDSAGVVAFDEPGLLGAGPLWLSVLSDGYELEGAEGAVSDPAVSIYAAPYDSGATLLPSAGAGATLLLRRTQIAQRMYRLTGAGLYRDAQLTGGRGLPASLAAAGQDGLLDRASGVIGQDTVMTAVFGGRAFWLWGDTACPRSARQNNCEAFGMHTVGATSCISSSSNSSSAECDVSLAPALRYFVNDSDAAFPHMAPMAPLPPLEQNTWLAGLAVIDDPAGPPGNRQLLFANYYKNPGDAFAANDDSTRTAAKPITGMAQWDASLARFVPAGPAWPADADDFLNGAHTAQVLSPRDAAARPAYVYYGGHSVLNPPIRVLATPAAMANYSAFEEFDAASGEWQPVAVARKAKARYRETAATTVVRFVGGGKLDLGRLPPGPSGAGQRRGQGPNQPWSQWGAGSVNYNAHAGAYLFFGHGGNGSFVAFGEAFTGPWVNGSWVSSHNASGASCYNALHLPHMDLLGGRLVHFACTYTAMWSETVGNGQSWTSCLFGLNNRRDCAPVVPRYEYNNLIYRVDLGDLPSDT